ncbi:hypothetical protein, partial [Aeromonas caviae]|uniref:hypothetical protein n=1 Tax=Aeromonas caviae TaxID=648 RepID=UPI001FC8C140
MLLLILQRENAIDGPQFHIFIGDTVEGREFNFEVQFPIKNQAAFRSSSKTTCGCLNPKHLRG